MGYGSVIKGITIDLGGADYVVPPLSIGALERLQDRLNTFQGGMDKEAVALMVDVAEAALKRNYPDITRDIIVEIMDVSNMEDIFAAVMDVSGLKRKAIDAGEAPAATAA
jgi:hypothetical protein